MQVFIKIERVPNNLGDAPEEIKNALIGLYVDARIFDPEEKYYGVINHKKLDEKFKGYVIEATDLVKALKEAHKFEAYNYWTKEHAITSDFTHLKFIFEKSACREI